jgi:xanthine dehydrogenase accessory factor
VHAPAGLDLGKTTHEEMAVAILAELVQLRASGALTGVPAPRVALRTELQLAEAVDPVCGMTVRPGAFRLPLEYEARTYYFCCSGCRRSFEEDPDAYIRAVLK